jgi:hypothetical protein
MSKDLPRNHERTTTVGPDELKRVVDEWLTEHDIPHYVPPALASEQYADASHPTADGYAALARGLVAQPSFAEFYGR